METVVSESSAAESLPRIKHAATRDIRDTHCLWSIHNIFQTLLLLTSTNSSSHSVFLMALRVSLTEQAHGPYLIPAIAIAEAPIPTTYPVECGLTSRLVGG
jgi:hypothetical protein